MNTSHSQQDLNNVSKADLIKSYLLAFLGALILVLLGHFLAMCINSLHLLSFECIAWIQNFSIIPVATALYGQYGWKIQTWGGETQQERLNQALFKILSTVGFLLTVISFHLKP